MPSQPKKSKRKTKKTSSDLGKKSRVLIFLRRGTRSFVDKAQFSKNAENAFEILRSNIFPEREGYVEVTFCLDREMKNINKEFRNKDKATDVLSFPSDFLNDKKVPTLGDILISVETAKRQSKDLKLELIKLFNHGILHLLGFDHENVSQKERQKMKRWERKLLKLLSS